MHPSTLAVSGGGRWQGPFSLATLQTWCLFSWSSLCDLLKPWRKSTLFLLESQLSAWQAVRALASSGNCQKTLQCSGRQLVFMLQTCSLILVKLPAGLATALLGP